VAAQYAALAAADRVIAVISVSIPHFGVVNIADRRLAKYRPTQPGGNDAA
jgi:hypothetical protein